MARNEARYEANPTAPRDARHFVHAALQDWSRDDLSGDAEVLTTEVVSDALRHKPSQVSVLVEHADGVVRVEVSDDPGLIMSAPGHGAFERRAGRRLLDALSRRWGSNADRHRTTTWFEVGGPPL